MLDSVNIGFSGLSTFSEGLRNISNNVANMNSNGYKGTTLQFSDLFYKMDLATNGGSTQSQYSQGSGVGIGYQGTNFSQGGARSTGSATDLAVDGNGFFILRKDGEQVYTRDGHFDFDGDGYLVDPSSGARVAGMSPSGELVDIDISMLQRSPAKATTEIKLSGTLNRQDQNGKTTVVADGIKVIDPSGTITTLTVTATKVPDVTPGNPNWAIQVEDEAGTVLLTGGDIRFDGTGARLAGFNSVSFTVTPAGGAPQAVALNFGIPGKTEGGVAAFSTGAGSLSVVSQDGYGLGELQKKTFDKKGVLTLEYSNGQKVTDKSVALAWFNDLQALTRSGGSQFLDEGQNSVRFGTAGTNGFGSIQGGTLEASNVDLASEFSQLIIIQRGYQSSSQVLGAANEMAQQVIELVKR